MKCAMELLLFIHSKFIGKDGDDVEEGGQQLTRYVLTCTCILDPIDQQRRSITRCLQTSPRRRRRRIVAAAVTVQGSKAQTTS